MKNVMTFSAFCKMMVDSGVYSLEVVASVELARLVHEVINQGEIAPLAFLDPPRRNVWRFIVLLYHARFDLDDRRRSDCSASTIRSILRQRSIAKRGRDVLGLAWFKTSRFW